MHESHTPVWIASPAQRTGTTLLQRLLCSDPDTLIYGESCAHDLNISLSFLLNKQVMLNQPRPSTQDPLQDVLAGRVNAWIPDLQPDRVAYLGHFSDKLQRDLDFFGHYAAARGRTRWGCKLPAWPVASLAQLLQQVPGSSVVYIYRDLKACVQSAKLIGLCHQLADVDQFCRMYVQNMRQARTQLPADRTLWLDYADLQSPIEVLARLAAFTGAQRMDTSVLEHRVNNYGTHYQAPAPLNEHEINQIEPYTRQTENLFSFIH